MFYDNDIQGKLTTETIFGGISGIKSLLDHKYRTLIEDKFISF